MLEKVKTLSQVEVKPDGTIFVKEMVQIIEDGRVISSIPHRTAIQPDQEIPENLQVYTQLMDLAPRVRTSEVISAYVQKINNIGVD